MTARILTVCTGNICRSPLAESLLRAGLGGLPVLVESAGTGAVDGVPATQQTVDLARQLGGHDLAAHQSRFLTDAMLQDADLVLTMTREHRAAVIDQFPGLTRRAFTIREFALLADAAGADVVSATAEESAGDPGARVRALGEAVSSFRGSVSAPNDVFDVVDPYRRGPEVYERSAAQIIPATRAVTSVVLAALT